MRVVALVWVGLVAVSSAASCGDDERITATGGSAGVGGDASVDGTGATGGSTGGAAGTGGGGAAGTDAGSRVPLDPLSIPKFQHELVIPPAMPSAGQGGGFTQYEIAVRQLEQQVLPPSLPKTAVWAYGKADDAGTFHSPAFTIEARVSQPIRIKWINGLVDASGNYLPHLLPVDPTLDWANPPGPPDSMGMGTSYLGPVPIVTHVHGGHTATVSDGLPEAWYLPAAKNIPAGYATQGSHFGTVEDAGAGAALFEYQNNQRAGTLWYHDHAMGITRLNVYAGLAGFYLIRDAAEDALGLPGPAPKAGDVAGTAYYEIPIAIQDRSFWNDGQLRYPSSRKEFDDYAGPYVPTTTVNPVWNPEVFGDTIMVNGRVWPYHEVEPRLYRLRLLNGCNARTLRLTFDKAVPFHRIGNDGGMLPGAPVVESEVALMPGERADVIVDLSSLAVGSTVKLLNKGPDEPFKGLAANQPAADSATTGQVLELRVVAKTSQGVVGAIPTSLPAVTPLTTTLAPRDLTLNEVMYEPEGAEEIPVRALLGTPAKGALGFKHAITEKPVQDSTEIWRVVNLTADAHPIHLHLVMFQVLDRRTFDADGFAEAQGQFLSGTGLEPKVDDFLTGTATPPHAAEGGWKDTVVANPGEVTRIIANFDMTGRYVWHCHILEHEDNEMMRYFEVLAK